MGQSRFAVENAARKKNAARLDRLEILAPLIKKAMSYRKMRAEVMNALNLPTYSLRTLKLDVEYLLKEWREERIENVDLNVQLELQRIDELVQEAWDAWERSKEDYEKEKGKQIAVPNIVGEAEGENGIEVVKLEQQKEKVRSCGDPRYIDTINKLLIERRKILGLYAPEKKEISGGLSFADFLMKTGTKKLTEENND